MIKRKPNPNRTVLEELSANSPELNQIVDVGTGEFGTVAPKPNQTYSTADTTEDLKYILGAGTDRFKQKVKQGISINDKEQRQLGQIAITLQTVVEIEAQQLKQSKYDKMTVDELINELYSAAMNFPEDKYIELIGRCLANRPIK